MRIVVEFSGGADSTLATILIKKKYSKSEIYPLFVDYGQEYKDNELEAAQRLSKKLKLEKLTIVRIENLKLTSKSNINEYIPYRNLIIGSITLNFADSIEANMIVNGSKSLTHQGDYDFLDSTLPFYVMLEAIGNYANEKGRKIKIYPILSKHTNQKMSKDEVYDSLIKEGISLNEVWSCFHPVKGKECKKCKNCKKKYDYLFRRSKQEIF